MNTSDIKEVGIHNHLLQRMVAPCVEGFTARGTARET